MKSKENERKRKKTKENERNWKKMKENVHFSLRNTGKPPRRALQNEHFLLKKVEMPKRQKWTT